MESKNKMQKIIDSLIELNYEHERLQHILAKRLQENEEVIRTNAELRQLIKEVHDFMSNYVEWDMRQESIELMEKLKQNLPYELSDDNKNRPG